MSLSDFSDSNLLSTYRAGLSPDATPAQKRDGGAAAITLIDRHRDRAFGIRNRVAPSLSDETVEDVLLDAIVVKSRSERVFRIDGDATYATWLHRVLNNGLISALRKESYRLKNETPLVVTTSDGEEIERPEVAINDTDDLLTDDMLRVVLDTVGSLASAHRLGEDITQVFLLRQMHGVVLPGAYERQPGRAEVMKALGVSERRARTLIDHADALVDPFRNAISEKFDVNRPVAETSRV